MRITMKLTLAMTLASGLSGCTTTLHPAGTKDELTLQAAAVKGPTGLVGMTASISLETVVGVGSVEVDVRDLKTGDEVTLRIDAQDLGPGVSDGSHQPLVFALPVGDYRVVGSRLAISGGYVGGGRQFLPRVFETAWARDLKPFTVRAEQLTHLGVVFAYAKSRWTNGSISTSYRSSVSLKQPSEQVWRASRALLAGRTIVYAEESRLGKVSWIELEWNDKAAE